MPLAPSLPSEERRRHQLVVTKRRATALLGAVAVLFVVVSAVGHGGWAGYVQATAEASLVGGLADWFAVTALFRRPLGLPIPHTAIVVERKEQFGVTLGEFVQESFLTPDTILERVRAAGIVARLSDWLVQPDNAARLASQGADAAVAFADLLHDDEIRDAIDGLLRDRVASIEAAPLGARVLTYLTRDGRHDAVVDSILGSFDRYLDAHREELRGRLSEQSPWWLPGAVEDRIFERLLDGARTALREMVGDPQHQLRRQMDRSLERFIGELSTSPDLRDRGELMKKELLAQPALREWAGAIWEQAKAELRAQAADPGSPLHRRLEAAVLSAGERLRSDPALAAKLSGAIEQAVSYVAERFHGEIAQLVSATIARWDAEETSRRLELLLGPDLQYIRINGTVVGAVAGLALYTLSRVV